MAVNLSCKKCSKPYDSERSLHAHVSKAHKLPLYIYYHTYYPRYDLYTGDYILFKNRNQYFNDNFNSRSSLNGYLTGEASAQEARLITLDLLGRRHDERGIQLAPCTVELDSLIFPSINTLQKIGVDYNEACSELGLKTRFDYNQKLSFVSDDNLFILQDTREQKPIAFSYKSVISKLDIGDYTAGGEMFNGVFIDRKSVMDLCGTISLGLERFKKELERTAYLDNYLIMVVESSLENFVSYADEKKHGQATSSFFLHNLRELLQSYSNFQVLFVADRSAMPSIIPRILLLQNDIRKIDLQYFYNSGQL